MPIHMYPGRSGWSWGFLMRGMRKGWERQVRQGLECSCKILHVVSQATAALWKVVFSFKHGLSGALVVVDMTFWVDRGTEDRDVQLGRSFNWPQKWEKNSIRTNKCPLKAKCLPYKIPLLSFWRSCTMDVALLTLKMKKLKLGQVF